jgi:HK97 family phage major capsid protein
MSIDQVIKQINDIENSVSEFQRKANTEISDNGKASLETRNILDKFGEKQRELADRLLSVEQNGVSNGGGYGSSVSSMGSQFTNSTAYGNFRQGDANKARFEVQNNIITGGDVTVAPDRKPSVVGGAFAPLTLEGFLPALPTSSNSVEYTRELAFSNSAAETAEAFAKPESSITFELQSMPVSTVAHWVRISRQLAEDAPALSAYINARMAYGVDRKVDLQLAAGNGVSPTISGLLDVGNYTTHAYTAAHLGAIMPKLVLIRKLISDLLALGYPADAIIVNPADWTDIQLELLLAPTNAMRVNIHEDGRPMLWGVPVIQAYGMTVDKVLVGAFGQAATVHNREGVVVELSESDSDNFTKNLITVRAERRLALTVDRPLAVLGGDLTPA